MSRLAEPAGAARHDWTTARVRELYDLPLLDLVFRAAETHRRFHDPGEIQVCRLVSVKTGGCPEDCAYCSQSARYQTGVDASAMMPKDEVLAIARRAREAGVTRLCMGAAWREVRDGRAFDAVLDMVRDVTDLGLEVCCTLGMLDESQARRLEDAGLHAYNHNIDTSPDYYETIITTRRFADRLATLETVRKTSLTVCCGGIIGMGESADDRIAMVATLARLNPHPESVPINVLSRVEGTPLGGRPPVPWTDVARMIAVARLTMPASVVRLSAGRAEMGAAEQAICFLAGANSIFSSEDGRMLTHAVPSPKYDADAALLTALGLRRREPFKAQRQGA